MSKPLSPQEQYLQDIQKAIMEHPYYKDHIMGNMNLKDGTHIQHVISDFTPGNQWEGINIRIQLIPA